MNRYRPLPDYLAESVSRFPQNVAVTEPGKAQLTYQELGALSDQIRDWLVRLGVGRGDRVGFQIRKSIDAVAIIWGILKAGAAYVPVDPYAPAWRGAYILNDCGVKVVFVEGGMAPALREEISALGGNPTYVVLESVGQGDSLRRAITESRTLPEALESVATRPALDDLAYILYTSGSTGKPKGVMLTHRNASSYVDWCTETFAPVPEDRFSSHAPFHFDLSILDIYVPLAHGATLVLISAETGKEPMALADLIAAAPITVWYSAPSILSMLAQFGKLERHRYDHLRLVLFAGEVFPVKHLRRTKQILPHPRYCNLFGPTETNVCTWYEIPREIPEERVQPYPIGPVCSHLQAVVTDEDGGTVGLGSEGELCIAGPSVLLGYWNQPEQTAAAFLPNRGDGPWYRTGDIVTEDPREGYIFVGRRDRMVKRRGHRIELAEVEAGLYRHPAIKEAAAVGFKDEDSGTRIKAFLSFNVGERPGLIALKQFFAVEMPMSMMPDEFAVLDALPRTSTDKIDYQQLKQRT